MKRYLAMLLAAVMLVGLFAIPGAAESLPYTDVKDTSWYYEAVQYCFDNGLMNGVSSTQFDPDGEVTREMAVCTIYRLADSPAVDATAASFTDVVAGTWYASSVIWAKQNAIAGGYPDGSFGVGQFVTREQFVKFFFAYAKLAGLDVSGRDNLSRFPDHSDTSSWALDAAQWAVSYGIISGKGQSDGRVLLAPKDTLTRAELATILMSLHTALNTPHKHTWDEGKVIVAATCTESGKMIYTCTECGETREETISALGHSMNDETVAPTCTHIGYSKHTCATCGYISIDTLVAALGHDYSSVITDPTCVAEGYTTYTCSRCGDSYVDDIVPATGIHTFSHDIDESEDVCATCGLLRKFYVAAASGDATADVSVYENYNAEIVIPAADVNASSLSVLARMNNVAGLGISGTREHRIDSVTGLSGEYDLSFWLEKAFNFSSATLKVKADNVGVTFDVTGEADEEAAKITAVPTSEDLARLTWQQLIFHIDASEQTSDDSYLVIANGSSLQLGNELLCFADGYTDDLRLDNLNDIGAINTAVRTATTLKSAEDSKYVAVLNKGTALAVGSSIATLKDNLKITVEGIESDAMNTLLSSLRDASSTSIMAKNIVKTINDAIGAADGKTVTVTIETVADSTHVHNFTSVVTNPTCTHIGYTTYTCTDCGYVYIDTLVSALGHDYTSVVTNPTCAEEGYTTYTCSRCGDSYVDDIVPATGLHSFSHDINESEDVCATCGMLRKAYFAAASNGATVDFSVYDNYAAELVMPAADVDASGLTILARLNEVSSLGVEGTRENKLDGATGLAGEYDLSFWLDNAYSFSSADVNVTVGAKSFTYHVTGEGDENCANIKATPDSAEKASAAWQELASHVAASTKSNNDSYIVLANGSTVQLGNELLCFEDGYTGDLLVNNLNDMVGLNIAVREAVKLTTAGDSKFVAVLRAGTKLAVGTSEAELVDDATITVEGLSCEQLTTLLSSLRSATTETQFAKTLIKTLNAVIGAADGATINVTVSFG